MVSLSKTNNYLTMAPTSNPERKLNKKIRLAVEKGQLEKAEKFRKELQHYLKCKEMNQKNKEKKELAKKVLTEEELFEQALEYNKHHSEDKEALKFLQEVDKKRSLEQAKRRASILHKKQQKQKQEEENKVQLKIVHDKYKKDESDTNKRLQEHESVLKEVYRDEIKQRYDDIMNDENNNKKKTKKRINKIFKGQSMAIEIMIHKYKDEKKVSYEEAFKHIHEQLRHTTDTTDKSTGKPKPKRILDSKAKL